jgi:hypothetical protein
MHYVTRISHCMQKQKFGVTFPDVHFVESIPGPPKHEKECVDNSWPERTGMHYVICKSHWMQKHRFNITCPGALFMETALGPPKLENSVLTLRALDTPECTM